MSTSAGWSKTKKLMTIAGDLLFFNLAILASFHLKFGPTIPKYNFSSYQGSALWIGILFVIMNLFFSVYVFYNKSVSDIIIITIISQIAITAVMMMVTFAGRWFSFPRSVLLINIVVGILFLSLWRLLIFTLYLKASGEKRIMILGSMEDVLVAVTNFEESKNNKHKVTTVVFSEFVENAKKYADEIDIFYLTNNISEAEKIKLAEFVVKQDKKLFVETDFSILLGMRSNMMNFEDESIVEVSDFRIPSEDYLFKRLFDIILSGLLLLITSPITLITFVLVKLTSKGPAIYKQVRITKNGREFNILKFRTMKIDAEDSTGPVLAKSQDNRITPIGKYLRSLRIDELPQLLNILKGDMSLVGPRPERPFFVDQFCEENSFYSIRHNVQAGLTGYAQVYGKYTSDFNTKLNFDLLYIKNYSLILDLKIMIQTVKILFDKVSAKGLDEEAVTILSVAELSERSIKVCD
ncbi:sugar transferase [Vagococcus sp. BWB3-3]|uniref:Sugar transferase n=1 Tax=Vagococcus allomyrinae TaxID=2794353 RepID=A0A940P9T8_9ENTE|nr:sugar transferase [Vagococcus allomyrinae]MBP1043670.1 sugar transferase [Vagococcus allomyrinae]